MSEPKPIYEFGEFRLNVEEKQLRRLSGEIVALSPKTFELLTCLVENHGHLLSKNELLDKVWTDSFVEEGNLKLNIHALRQILPKTFIETVPKHGYRFAGEVKELNQINFNQNISAQNISVQQTAVPTVIDGQSVINQQTIVLTEEAAKTVAASLNKQVRKQTFIYSALALIFIGLIGLSAYYFWKTPEAETSRVKTIAEFPSRSMAVLPFKNLTKDKQDEFLSIGLADSLITKLGSINRISVRPTSAVLPFDENTAPQMISEKLQVEIVLEGTIQRIGKRLKISAQLVQMPDNRILWANGFEENESDLLKIQDLISEQIVRSLEINLDQEERSLFARHETASYEAYQLYLKGRYHWNKRTKEDLAQSIEFLQKSVETDANFALAHAALAEAFQLYAEYGGMNPAEAFEKSRQSALKTLELAPHSAEARNSLAYTLAFYDWNWAEAEREFQKALELNPNYPTARQWYGEYFIVFGKFAEAEEQMLQAQQLDPTSQIIDGDLASLYYISRQFDRCLEHTAKTLRQDEKSPYANAFRWLCYEAKGDIPKAFEALQKGDAFLFPEEFVKGQQTAFEKYGWQGVWKFKEDFFDTLPTNQFINNYTRAFISLRAGNPEKAFEWLEKSYQNRERWFVNLKHDPQFESLRNDPRFAELLAKINP